MYLPPSLRLKLINKFHFIFLFDNNDILRNFKIGWALIFQKKGSYDHQKNFSKLEIFRKLK